MSDNDATPSKPEVGEIAVGKIVAPFYTASAVAASLDPQYKMPDMSSYLLILKKSDKNLDGTWWLVHEVNRDLTLKEAKPTKIKQEWIRSARIVGEKKGQALAEIIDKLKLDKEYKAMMTLLSTPKHDSSASRHSAPFMRPSSKPPLEVPPKEPPLPMSSRVLGQGPTLKTIQQVLDQIMPLPKPLNTHPESTTDETQPTITLVTPPGSDEIVLEHKQTPDSQATDLKTADIAGQQEKSPFSSTDSFEDCSESLN